MDYKAQITEHIAHLAAAYISTKSNRTSLITVTRCGLSDKGTTASIFVTILPESEQTNAMIFLKRLAGDFREYLKERGGMQRIPHIHFEFDIGEVNRQKMDLLFQEVQRREHLTKITDDTTKSKKKEVKKTALSAVSKKARKID